MRLLLDTHALLWFLADDSRLTQKARSVISESDEAIFVSVVSLWEIAIKQSLGKLELAEPFEVLFPAQLALNEMTLLSISTKHLSALISIPFHHRDPFDRLLIAQAISEELSVVTRDIAFSDYSVDTIWR